MAYQDSRTGHSVGIQAEILMLVPLARTLESMVWLQGLPKITCISLCPGERERERERERKIRRLPLLLTLFLSLVNHCPRLSTVGQRNQLGSGGSPTSSCPRLWLWHFVFSLEFSQLGFVCSGDAGASELDSTL